MWLWFIVQSLSCVWLFATPWTAALQASLSFTISQGLLKLVSAEMWCHPTISSSVACFSSCPQSFPASGSFPMSWLFTSGGQSTEASASASVSVFEWIFRVDFLYDWLVWSCYPSDSQESSPAPQFNTSAFSLLYGPTLTSHTTTGKTIVLTIQTIVGKVMFLLFNMLSRFVIAFLPRGNYLLISWL